MDEASALITIAELALGLIGFTGIVAALSLGSDGWHASDDLRMRLLLLCAVSVLLLALLAGGFFLSGLSDDAAVAASSAAMLLCAIAGTIYVIPRVREFRRVHGEDSQLISPAVINGSVIGSFVNIASQLINCIGIVWSPSFAVFYGGLVWYLMVGVAGFVRMLLIRPPRE